MRILAVGPKIPYPPTDGGRIGIFQPLRQLATRGHAVSYLGFGEEAEAREFQRAAQLSWAHAVPHDTRTRVWGALGSVFSALPYTASKYRSPEMTIALEGALHKAEYDLVQLEGTHMAHYLGVIQGAGVPVVLHLHNMEWLLAQRFARTVRGPLRWFVTLQAARMRRFETAACTKADLCLTFTPEDSTRVKQLAPGARVAVMPGGVDVREYAGFTDCEDPHTVTLLGAFDWPPNVDAARWFHQNIWPRIVRSVPEARWILVGEKPPAEFYRWQKNEPSLVVTGYVEDVRPYLAKAAVVVVPLRSGGGMRLKIPEAFAMRKALVSTRLGAEGLGALAGVHLLLADEEEEFAGEVVRLLSSAPDRARLGSAAYLWVASHLSWGDILARVEGEYTSLARLPRHPVP